MGRVKTPVRLARERTEAEIAQRRAAAAEHAAQAVRHAVLAAMEGGLVAGLGIWAHDRVGQLLQADHLEAGGDDVVMPGVAKWIAAQIGLVVGPVLGVVLPRALADNGRALARWHRGTGWQREFSLREWGDDVLPRVHEGWYDVVGHAIEVEDEHAIVPPGEPRPMIAGMYLDGWRISESTRLMIAAATSLGMVGLVEAVKAAAGKVAGKVP